MIPAPRHIVRVAIHALEDDVLAFLSPPLGPFEHPVRGVVDIDARSYPLEQHCRFVCRHVAEGPYTFSNMAFHPEPPGLRVGPWPGWRGIPVMPEITLTWGECVTSATVHWWGDELDQRRLRAVVWFPAGCSGMIQCSVDGRGLTPCAIDLFEDHPLTTTSRATALLPALQGRHPRLLLTEEDIPVLRKRALTTHRVHMDRIRALLAAPYLPPEVTAASKVPSGPERLRPEDRAMLTALVAIIDPSPESARRALEAFRDFMEETRRPDYAPLGIDTQSGEMLFVLVLTYDWLFPVMSEQERVEARSWLSQVAGRVRGHLTPDRHDFGQAHYLGCALGLLSFSCVLYEDHPDAGAWLNECRGALDTVLSMLPEDGFHPHGVNMWIYEYGFLLRWIEIFRVCTGEDHWDHPHWKNASAFRAATLSPDALYGVTFGDAQYRVGGDAWCHYLIAARTGSSRAMWTGDALVDGPHPGIDFRSIPPRRRLYEFLYHDPGVASGDPRRTVEHVADGGQIMIRTGGVRDGLFTCKAGPPLGATRYAAGERGGYGHADPCNGSFLWHVGDTFMVSGPGPTYRRDSALHNVITVNGRGQIGDGTVWIPDFFPPAVLSPRPVVTEGGDTVSISVDLAVNYLPHLGIQRCHRALCIDPVRCRITGVDEVDLRAPGAVEWNLHSGVPFTVHGGETVRLYRAAAPGATLSAFLISPPEGECATGLTEFVPAYPHDGTRDHFLRWSVTGTRVRFIWCLTLEAGYPPPVVEGSDDALMIIYHDGTSARYDGVRLCGTEAGCSQT